jgi:hypothetical protein
LLKPAQRSEVILDSEIEETENDNSETMYNKDYYEHLGPDQTFLQQEGAP